MFGNRTKKIGYVDNFEKDNPTPVKKKKRKDSKKQIGDMPQIKNWLSCPPR